MPGWDPDQSNIDKKEVIARRIFRSDPNSLFDDVSKLKFDDVHDTRLDENISVDRLGINSPNRSAKQFVTRLADSIAASRSKSFVGWAAIVRDRLPAVDVRPVPITEEDIENIFHAEIMRSDFRKKNQARHFSNSLRLEFQTKGFALSPGRA